MSHQPEATRHKTERVIVIDVDVCVFIACIFVAYIVVACNG